MYPERLLHKALTLIGPRRGGSFCPRMCVGVGLRVRVRVGWAGLGWGGGSDPTFRVDHNEVCFHLNPMFLSSNLIITKTKKKKSAQNSSTFEKHETVPVKYASTAHMNPAVTEVLPSGTLAASLMFVHFVSIKGLNRSLCTV